MERLDFLSHSDYLLVYLPRSDGDRAGGEHEEDYVQLDRNQSKLITLFEGSLEEILSKDSVEEESLKQESEESLKQESEERLKQESEERLKQESEERLKRESEEEKGFFLQRFLQEAVQQERSRADEMARNLYTHENLKDFLERCRTSYDHIYWEGEVREKWTQRFPGLNSGTEGNAIVRMLKNKEAFPDLHGGPGGGGDFFLTTYLLGEEVVMYQKDTEQLWVLPNPIARPFLRWEDKPRGSRTLTFQVSARGVGITRLEVKGVPELLEVDKLHALFYLESYYFNQVVFLNADESPITGSYALREEAEKNIVNVRFLRNRLYYPSLRRSVLDRHVKVVCQRLLLQQKKSYWNTVQVVTKAILRANEIQTTDTLEVPEDVQSQINEAPRFLDFLKERSRFLRDVPPPDNTRISVSNNFSGYELKPLNTNPTIREWLEFEVEKLCR